MKRSDGISEESFSGRSSKKIGLKALIVQNARFLSWRRFPPGLEAALIRAICFYQRRLSRHTCLYEPTCSEYTKRCIHNWGAIVGTLMGMWRILRCNPFSKGGYDPAPEFYWKVRWLY